MPIFKGNFKIMYTIETDNSEDADIVYDTLMQAFEEHDYRLLQHVLESWPVQVSAYLRERPRYWKTGWHDD